MFKDLIGKDVLVLVATRGEMVLEYTGVLISEGENTLKLENVSISTAILSFQRNMFGNINSYKDNISEIIVNKEYVVSCNVR